MDQVPPRSAAPLCVAVTWRLHRFPCCAAAPCVAVTVRLHRTPRSTAPYAWRSHDGYIEPLAAQRPCAWRLHGGHIRSLAAQPPLRVAVTLRLHLTPRCAAAPCVAVTWRLHRILCCAAPISDELLAKAMNAALTATTCRNQGCATGEVRTPSPPTTCRNQDCAAGEVRTPSPPPCPPPAATRAVQRGRFEPPAPRPAVS